MKFLALALLLSVLSATENFVLEIRLVCQPTNNPDSFLCTGVGEKPPSTGKTDVEFVYDEDPTRERD